MKEHLTYFRNFLLSFSTNLIELFSNITITRVKAFGKELIDKIKNFKGTNWDLALYHFRAGNLNDAIMRFKLVQKADYQVSACNYFLGRLYQEKNKPLEAKKYFELYLASQETDYLEEVNYCLALISDQAITAVPISLMVKKRELLVFHLEKASFEQENLDKIFALTELCRNQAINSNKTLELGCNLGFIGKLLKMTVSINYLKGKDFGKELIKISGLLQDEKNVKFYNDLVLTQTFQELFEEESLYNLVIISDLMDYYSNVSEIIMEGQSLLESGGHLLLAFRSDDSPFNYSHLLDEHLLLSPLDPDIKLVPSDKTYSFIKELEVFSFNPNYVKSLSESLGFNVKTTLKVSHFNIFLLNKC